MQTLEQIIEAYPEAEFLRADGLDAAIIGVEAVDLRLVYDVNKVIKILMAQGMTEADAWEYYTFNIEGAFVGPQTPIWCQVFKH